MQATSEKLPTVKRKENAFRKLKARTTPTCRPETNLVTSNTLTREIIQSSPKDECSVSGRIKMKQSPPNLLNEGTWQLEFGGSLI
jgi:hypothetical protein